MKNFLPLTALLFAFGAAATAQETTPDPTELRTRLSAALHGRVDEVFPDGELALSYAFERAEELLDFETEGGGLRGIRVDEGCLKLEKNEEERVTGLRFAGIHWTQRFSLRLRVTAKWPNSGLMIGLADSREDGGQTLAVVNGLFDPAGTERYHALIPLRANGRPIFPEARRAARAFPVDEAVELALVLEAGRLRFTVGNVVVAEGLPFRHPSFVLFLVPSGPEIRIDDLRFFGQPVSSSVRKLVRGGAAKDSEEAKKVEGGDTASGTLARERLQEPLPESARDALGELEGRARELAIRARAAEGDYDFARAARVWEEVLVRVGDAPIAAWRAGRARLLAGDPERARVALDLATKLDPDLSPAWRDLAAALDQLDLDQEALAAFDRAVSLDPYDALGRCLRAMHLIGRGQLDEGEQALLAVLAENPGHAAAQALRDEITKLRKPPAWAESFGAETPHYRVDTNVSKEFADRVAERLERYRGFLAQVLPLPETRRDAQSRVWIFDARGEYNVFAGSLMSRQAERTAGVYHPGIKTLLLFDEVDRESTFDTLFHEGFHQYLDLVNPNPPIWFNEGLAEVFGAVRFDEDGQPRTGVQRDRLRELAATLRDEPERIPDFDVLMRLPKVRFYESASVSLNYATAWAFCFYATSGNDEELRALFRRYARAVFAGERGPAAYAASFGATDGRKAESFKAGWLRFVRSL